MRTEGQAKASVDRAEGRDGFQAVGRSAVRRIVEPTAATVHAEGHPEYIVAGRRA